MNLRWTSLAAKHLKAVHEYIAAENIAAADELVDRILIAIEQLMVYPEIGRKGRVKDTRELVVVHTPFIVAYRIKQNSVQILAIIHGARRWPEQL